MKKNIKLLIILAAIICVILVVALLALSHKQSGDLVRDEEFRQAYLERSAVPSNIIVLYQYRGENDRNDLYVSFNDFLKYIDKLSKEVKSDEDAEKYFENHYNEIRETLGIKSKTKFKNLVKSLSGKNVNYNEYVYSTIDPNSVVQKGNYFHFDISFYYGTKEENYTPLKVKVQWNNIKNAEDVVIYEIG